MNCYKRAFESQGMAEVILEELISSGNKDAKKLTVYKCNECEMWHFTSYKQE